MNSTMLSGVECPLCFVCDRSRAATQHVENVGISERLVSKETFLAITIGARALLARTRDMMDQIIVVVARRHSGNLRLVCGGSIIPQLCKHPVDEGRKLRLL